MNPHQRKARQIDYARVLAWVIIILIPVWFLYSVRPQNGVYVGVDGRPNCLWGRLYCIVQPARFYRSQRNAIDRSIAFQKGIIPLMDAANAQAAADINRIDV